MIECSCCGKPLNRALKSEDGRYKSCPRCSQTHGQFHIFRKYPDDFGTTPSRVTPQNPDGPQSHCLDCRRLEPGEDSTVDLTKELTCNQL